MSNPRYPHYPGEPPYGATPMGDRQAPYPPPPDARPAQAPTWGDFAVTGSPFSRIPLDQVWTLMPQGRNIAMFNQQRPVTVTADAQSTVTGGTSRLTFDRPTAVFQITGTAISTDAANPIVGDPRDTFTIDLQRASGAERFLTTPVLGSCVVGTAERPFKIAPNAWLFGSGEALIVIITPQRPSLLINVNFSTAPVRGPANFTWSSVPAGS